MRKIRIIEQISLEGVIQAPGGRDEGGDDYAHGGWAMLYGSAPLIDHGLSSLCDHRPPAYNHFRIFTPLFGRSVRASPSCPVSRRLS